MPKKLYFRCNSGHYFDSEFCPFDGWTVPGFTEALSLAERLTGGEETVSIPRMREEGVPEEVLSRTLLIEFASDESVFEALNPAGYILNGKDVPINSVGPSLR